MANNNNHEYDVDDMNTFDVPWCYGCDGYAVCGVYEPDGAPVHQWEVTEPAEVYATDDYYDDYPSQSGAEYMASYYNSDSYINYLNG